VGSPVKHLLDDVVAEYIAHQGPSCSQLVVEQQLLVSHDLCEEWRQVIVRLQADLNPSTEGLVSAAFRAVAVYDCQTGQRTLNFHLKPLKWIFRGLVKGASGLRFDCGWSKRIRLVGVAAPLHLLANRLLAAKLPRQCTHLDRV
jgi:hypothetical protein